MNSLNPECHDVAKVDKKANFSYMSVAAKICVLLQTG